MRENTTTPLLTAEKRPGEFVPGTWSVRYNSRIIRLGCLIKFDGRVFCANNCGTHIKSRFKLLHNPELPVTQGELIHNWRIPVDFFERSHLRITPNGCYGSQTCLSCQQE